MEVEDLHVSLSSDDPAVGLRASLALHRLAERVEASRVHAAREKGWSWQQIGDALGVTRQSVHTKYGKESSSSRNGATTVRYHPWTTVLWASEEARRRGDRRAGTDHLLLGLLEEPSVVAVLGVSLQEARDALDSLDREALGALGMGPGIDAPELRMHTVPRRPTIKDVIKDRIRTTPAAKKALKESGKPMRRGKAITPQQVLARVLDLEPPDPAAALLGVLGVDTSAVRRRLDAAGLDS